MAFLNASARAMENDPMDAHDGYRPPYRITSRIVYLISEISEALGALTALHGASMQPRLRRKNRIQTIHASLAIENNTLSLDQTTAVIDGKKVLGPPREIQEVHNALRAYDAMPSWTPSSRADLLAAHGLLMAGLSEEAGVFRRGNVGVFAEDRMVHMAPPARRIPDLMEALLTWLRDTEEHPLVAGSVFHYELEFIHPFADGNGRMGRLWHTLILQQWKPLLAWVPVETAIHARQSEYYQALSQSDRAGDATSAVEFLLDRLRESITEVAGGTPADIPKDEDDPPIH